MTPRAGNPDRRGSRALLWSGLLVLAGCSEPTHDPMAAIAAAASPVEGPSVAPLVVPLQADPPAEGAERQTVPDRRVLVLAGEPSILALLGAELEETFESRARTRDLRLRPAPARGAVTLASSGQADAALVAGPLDPDSAGSLVRQEVGHWVLALCAHPDLPLQNLTRPQARDLLAGRIRSWSRLNAGMSEVQLVLPEPGAAAELIGRVCLPGEALADGGRRWSEPAAGIELVRGDPAALGVLPLRALSGAGLRLIAIEGARPDSSTAWPYAAPVHLLAAAEGDGDREVLAAVLRELLQ